MNLEEEIKLEIAQLNRWTKLYNEGYPEISDKTWDDAYFRLAELERKTGIYMPDSPTQKVDYQVVSKLIKVMHNHPMLSLAKTKDWDEFISYFSGKDVIGMPKMDGLTGSLRYIDGKLISAQTRGNGSIGEDITHNAMVIPSIPKKIPYKDELVIDGEFICTYQDFEAFSDEYANPRNFAAGSIRLLDAKECASRKLTFVVWNVIKGFDDNNSFLHRLQNVKKLGFTIVPYTSSFDWDAKEFLQNQAKELGYPIDGLVGRFDDIEYGTNLGTTGHHARAAYAFKFYDDEYETTLINIEYDVSRNGEMVPVAIFEPVDDGVSIIERASLHNLSIMKDTLHSTSGWIGQKIKVAKMNQIIPQIVWAEEDDDKTKSYIFIPDKCSECGAALEIKESDSGVKSLYCSNVDCPRRLINRLDHFCGKTGLDIKGLSKATLEKLIEWEWVNDILDIYKLDQYAIKWKKKVGFGPKSVSNILEAIEASKHCKLANFISSLGIPQVGTNTAKQLAEYFGTWEKFINAVDDDDFKFWSLPDIGPETNYAIKHFCYATADELASFMDIEPAAAPIQDGGLLGLNIVITGSLNVYKNRDALKEDIEAHGGKVIGSVSKNTSVLINNDSTSTSAKNVKAQSLGIPILTEEEFIEKYLK